MALDRVALSLLYLVWAEEMLLHVPKDVLSFSRGVLTDVSGDASILCSLFKQ